MEGFAPLKVILGIPQAHHHPPKVENLCKRVKIKQQFLNKYVWSFTLDSGEGMGT